MSVRKKKSFFLPQSGSILIYVLWLSALLGLFTLSAGYGVRQRLNMLERLEIKRTLRLSAESGIERGLWAIHYPKDPKNPADSLTDVWSRPGFLFKDVSLGKTVFSVIKTETVSDYGLRDEESRINLNLLKDDEVLKRLLIMTAGISTDQAAILADSVLDWIDEDSDLHASGAENLYYRSLKRPLLPKNAALDVVEELLYVRDMTPEILKNLQPYITLHGDGKVNLNTASQTVLEALTGHKTFAEKIISYRQGPDRLEGTADDPVFTKLAGLAEAFESLSGLDDEIRQIIDQVQTQGIFKIDSKYFRIQSAASLKGRAETLSVQAVAGRNDGIQFWKEFYTQKA